MADELKPPSVEIEDPGAHELDSSDEFTDASEGHKSVPSRSGGASPIPIMRVERVDDAPAHGEVPGTAAYQMRAADAVPDEVEVVPEGQRSRSLSTVNASDAPRRVPSIPKMVVEKVDPDVPSYGDVPGTAAYELRKADAEPDEIIKSPITAPSPDPWNEPTGIDRSPLESQTREAVASPTPHDEYNEDHDGDEGGNLDDGDEEGGFGDDFDDFEEGEEAGDDDFGDFDEGFATEPTTPMPAPQSSGPPPALFPIPDYAALKTREDINDMTVPYIRTLFPSTADIDPSEPQSKPSSKIFLTERSHSLYTQLIAPPPLAPPDWLRSRIRRLFLVSLGVPVDLDEILPASKQKKLILPSIHGTHPTDPAATAPAANGAVSRLKSNNESSASVDSKGRRRRKEDTVPVFDQAESLRFAGTTDVKMEGMADEELQAHVLRGQELVERAEEVLSYWRNKTESAVREKEAFEGVIENLVKHARKVRK